MAFLATDDNPILGLNVVIDDQRRLGFASYGSIISSHAKAVDFVRSFAEVGVAGPKFGTVVTSSAGYPLDKTYYQTVKGWPLSRCQNHCNSVALENGSNSRLDGRAQVCVWRWVCSRLVVI